MKLNYILLSDGTSDRALIPIIDDALKKFSRFRYPKGTRADLSRYPRPAKRLFEKIEIAQDLYNPEIIFIHRDAEKEPIEKRIEEIDLNWNKCKINRSGSLSHVKVIPVRMTEAWLLIDEQAVKFAAGNPNFTGKLALPPIHKLEYLPDPKMTLTEAIKTASCLSGRGLKKLDTGHCIQLIPQYINDFDPLMALKSYQFLKSEIEEKLSG